MSLSIQKTFNAVFENGFNPVLGSIPRLPIKRTANPVFRGIFKKGVFFKQNREEICIF